MTKSAFDKKLKELNLKRQDFCNLTGLAYSSVSNWNDRDKPIPLWVDSYLELYAHSKALKEIITALKPFNL